MNLLLGFAHQTGVRLAEVGFLLLLFAGVWLVAAHIPKLKFGQRQDDCRGRSARRGRPAPHHRHALGSLRLEA